MVEQCRQHGVDIYVDVVINHMAGGLLGDPAAEGRDGTPWQYRCNALQGPSHSLKLTLLSSSSAEFPEQSQGTQSP